MSLVGYPNLPVKMPQNIVESGIEPISQGAEAILVLMKGGKLVKYRPAKSYRLPQLDTQLRKRRAKQEARIMKKLAASGVRVPTIYDCTDDTITMEFIEGKSLKEATWQHQKDNGSVSDEARNYYRNLAASIAAMHSLNIVHGDLTTSNAMVTLDGEVALIDFGLGSQDAGDEDKAVDLYVLERAIKSTHPREAEELMAKVFMPAYIAEAEQRFKNTLPKLLSRLEAVRKRGRKRTQLG